MIILPEQQLCFYAKTEQQAPENLKMLIEKFYQAMNWMKKRNKS